MTPAQWLDALEAEGVNVTGYEDWKTHGRDAATGKTFGAANGVVIHHTAGVSSLSLCYNGTSSLPGPLCHTHLSKTAVARMLSVRRANHAGTFAQNAHNAVLAESPVHPYPDEAEPVDGNDHYYGLEIENLGDGEDPYPWVQYVAAVKWATAICRHHGWTEHSVIGHKEGTRRKIDPKGPIQGGPLFTMDRFRTHVKEALALPAGVWPNQEEDVTLSAEDKAWIKGEIDKVAPAVWDRDDIPASVPPYNNSDYDDGNTTWTARYALGDAVLKPRQVRAELAAVADKVDAVAAKVDSISVGGVDLDALAEKVADVLYQRLQN